MSAAASFVIPVLNEQAIIADLLCDLRARYPHSPLIVVDGGSRDDTVAVAQPLCDQLLLAPPGRARQMNLGARAAATSYLFFLHADSVPGVASAALDACLEQRPVWGFCRIRLSGDLFSLRVIEWFMNQRSRITQVATGDQMLFMQKAVFDGSGGFDDIPLMEDIAYCKRLRRLARAHIIDTPVLTSSRRWEEGGVISTVVRMWSLRLAYFLGVSPKALWRHYYGR